jgi:hypothetical protein
MESLKVNEEMLFNVSDNILVNQSFEEEEEVSD